MRLDHLLSREIRVSTLGGVEALMAPRVDRTVARVSPPGGARRRRSARIEAGGRYATWKEHRTHSDIRNAVFPVTLQGLRCSRPRATTESSNQGLAATRGGRLAQLVEHLICKERVRSSSLLVSTTFAPESGAIEQFGSIPEAIADSRGPTRIEPLIRDLPARGEVTDQRIAGRRIGVSRTARARSQERAHLNNWICFGRLKIFDFAE